MKFTGEAFKLFDRRPPEIPGHRRHLLWEGQLYETQLIINGRDVCAEQGATFDRRNPISDTVVTRSAAGRALEARGAVSAAAAAFSQWSETPPPERCAILGRAADLMQHRLEEVVEIAAQEVGSSPEWVRFNVGIAASILRQAMELGDAVGEEQVSKKGYILRRKPVGVVLGIAPWNAAVALATRAVAAPLACGNTVVLKASELCPKTHEWVVRCLNDAGLPEGVLNYFTNAPDHAQEVVEALIAHPAVRRINFTGSTRVGREIAVAAARHLKPCLLELSGKGTMIVLSDADLGLAAKAAAHGSFFNQGQVCMSTERVIVEDTVADAFMKRFVAETTKLRALPGQVGPLGNIISPAAASRASAMIADAVQKGARVATGGDLSGGTPQPTILDGVLPGMRIYDEEVFGPVVGVIRVGDRDEAAAIANDTEFGLVAAVFSRDQDRALDMLRQIETGIGHVNGSTVFDDPAMPFGGVKASGYGRFGGRQALAEFTEYQWIAIHDGEPPDWA